MEKKVPKLLGYITLILGISVIAIQSLSPITGAVIGITTKFNTLYFILGIILTIIGIILSTIESVVQEPIKITKSKRFIKAIKGKDRKAIDRAVGKLKTGLGSPKFHWLTEDNYLRVDKGGRITYENRPDGSITLTDYKSSSEHY
jgi:hypothetical protein